MRYSTIKGEPGYKELDELFKNNKRLRVFFRGEEQHECIMADDKEGVIVRYLKINGKFAIERGRPKTVKLQGSVRFEIVDEPK